ncbi:MAG: phospho-sugar mutase [Acidimicrobiia bacterium]|nr:phospho-sugar mutase [Acidimicrobiia bacterium]
MRFESAVRAWIAIDPDAAHRAELEALLEAGDEPALEARFGQALRFGTAGLRGALGAGSNRMNEVTVARAAMALLRWRPQASVVIGYDARHGSRRFAEVTAQVVAGSGGRPLLIDAVTPTPVLAFAVRDQQADLGVMVTASHNPPADNGYKVYRADGAQLIPPADREIEAEMDAVADDAIRPFLGVDQVLSGVTLDHRALIGRYLDAVVPGEAVGHPVVAYTPLHGVGADVFAAALERVGLEAHVVASQARPDPDFPTVAFPNPEEPGALDALLELATVQGADVALAHDPDADRLAMAVPTDRGWEALTGNELGALLADHRLATTRGQERLVVTTVVSSRLLAKLAAENGVRFEETLTGFKWVMRPAIETDLTFVFGYEEALGYAVNDLVRDKDGISAGLVALAAIERLRTMDLTPRQRLDELARHHGLHVSDQRTLVFDGPDASDRMAGVMNRIRTGGWSDVGGRAVVDTVDFADGSHDPGTDLLRFDLEDGSRIQIRPSGTEPKLKLYGEVVLAVAPHADVATTRDEGRVRCTELLAAAVDAIG